VTVTLLVCLALSSCEYGTLGGADMQATYYYGTPEFEQILSDMSGVWYSHYGAMRTDGYRIGRFGAAGAAFEAEMGTAKLDLFPDMQRAPYKTCATPGPIASDAFYVFYDDTVYGQSDKGAGGNGGWSYFVMRYVGIVRAVNIFNGDPGRGAIIIEYLDNACPTWDNQIAYGQRPFFGIFYRAIDRNTVQMANAVDLAALAANQKYYTETAALEDAVAKNDVSNEAEFISWGVVLPQDREQK
jgi:hypothetical protein